MFYSCDTMYCSMPGSSVPGILQARILAWVAIPSPGLYCIMIINSEKRLILRSDSNKRLVLRHIFESQWVINYEFCPCQMETLPIWKVVADSIGAMELN